MQSRDDLFGVLIVAMLLVVFVTTSAFREPPGLYLQAMPEIVSD